jgi:small-conductance mechanosensitive channel
MAESNTDAEPEVLTEAERAELLALYQVNTQDLANFKDQQWTLTNYTLVAFAAIIGVPRIPGIEVSICGRLVLCVIATIVALLATWLIWRLRTSIEDRRKRNERIFPRLTPAFRAARGDKTAISSTEMYVFLVLFLLIGLGLVWWLVYAVK